MSAGVPAEAIAAAEAAFSDWWDETGAIMPSAGILARIELIHQAALVGWAAAAPVITAQAAAAERELLLAQLREFLPRYVGIVIHTCTPDGTPVYATGPVGFPDALVDTFALMTVPDADLLGQDAP